MSWINVKDELPKNRSQVLICDDNGIVYLMEFREVLSDFRNKGDIYFKPSPEFNAFDKEDEFCFPTDYWMPIPKNPKE